MSTVTAPNPDGRKKFKSRLSSFGPTSISPSSSPSNMQANLPELFALLTTRQEADEDEHNARTSERFEYDGASDAVENETSFGGEDRVIVREKPEPEALTEPDVVSKERQFLQEKGPAEDDDLLEALQCPLLRGLVKFSKARPNAFLNQRPGFRALHELYSFVCNQDLEDENDERGCSSLVEYGATTGLCLASSIDCGAPYAVASHGGPRRARTSSSLSVSGESVVDGKDEEQVQRLLKDDRAQ
ncbi:hypothetical protein HPB49_022722 [Dermacentor silvarum]|uniref:Uncharacterized protein n=1 Tax=Dermacentor silvarum TaxID=543639 RepID=A0ACB8CTW5_DERSI|nr:hypothetical protein HPB49_022722 [Dermacentor silvarum]